MAPTGSLTFVGFDFLINTGATPKKKNLAMIILTSILYVRTSSYVAITPLIFQENKSI